MQVLHLSHMFRKLANFSVKQKPANKKIGKKLKPAKTFSHYLLTNNFFYKSHF